MPAAIRPANRIVNRVLRFTVANLTRLRFRARYDAGVLDSVQPPFLLIGNHTCNFDAFLMSLPVKGPIHFVASDEYFRTPLLRFLLRLVGGIPKIKNVSDLQPVRRMLALKKAGAVIGIYPEGNRSWDGLTGPLFGSTAKLIKLFRIPVLAVETTGGSLSHPRWARFARTGRMHLDYRLLFTAEDCGSLSEKELFVKMVAALAHDDHPDAVKRAARTGEPFRFRGRRLAERLELYLFQCPSCRQTDTLASRDDRLRCTACGLTVRYGEDGRFHPADPSLRATPVPFSLTRDWDRWQRGNLQEAIRSWASFPQIPPLPESGIPGCGTPGSCSIKMACGTPGSCSIKKAPGRSSGRDTILLKNTGAFLRTGGRYGKLKPAGSGTILLHPDRLAFRLTGPGAETLSWPLAGISGLNIQYNNRFEFYHHDILHRFSFPEHPVSVWKWHQALLYAMEAQPSQDAGPTEQV